MPPLDTSLTRVRVSATSGGVYNVVGYVRSFELTEGEEGGGRTLYFGGEIHKAGDSTLNGSMPALFDLGDTNGQEFLRTSKRNGDMVWLQFLPQGTTAGSRAYQFEARITEISIGSDRDDEWVSGSFAFEGNPSTLTIFNLV